MKARLFLFQTLLFFPLISIAQHMVNSEYGNKYATANQSSGKLYLTDSKFIIEAKVLLNTLAENYVAVFGVSQEAKSLYF